jgi:asparagine synthase (glutamine-hydrolysing)
MCGIAGIVGEAYDKRLVPSMLEAMQHRGPDSRGFYMSDGIHLGHCRLSIIDLSERATQPFISSTHGVATAVNGEIYNFQELRKTLEAKGYTFQSSSDSEVVLHAYIEYGLDFISGLNGMFALSIWDEKKKEVMLVRDRLGIKPLYYVKTKEAFLFASEIKALSLYQDLDFSLDFQSFAEYLAFENYFSNRTLNEHVKLVEPGEVVKFNPAKNIIDRSHFWRPNLGISTNIQDTEIYNQYVSTIKSSVDRHLISDVPVGCYLSAGIDSSSVTYWSSQKYGSSLKTFTGSFGMSGFYDEASTASKISDYFGCPNYNVEIRAEDFRNDIEKILWHLDEPKVGMGSFSQYMVAKKAATEVKVILTGHGGDEFFAGYPVFKAIFGKKNIPKLIANSSFRELMFAVYFSLYPKIRKEAGYFLPNIFPLKSFQNLLQPDFFRNIIRETDIYKELEGLKHSCHDEYERLTLTYLKYYLPSLFVVEDKISMAFSLESRTPLCDNEMLDLALSIPLSSKLTGYELKHIPRAAMKNRLPGFIYNLPKRGFPTPLKLWFRRELKDYVRSYILDNVDSTGLFNRKEAERIISKFQNPGIPNPFEEITAHKIWIILNLIIYIMHQRKRYKA